MKSTWHHSTFYTVPLLISLLAPACWSAPAVVLSTLNADTVIDSATIVQLQKPTETLYLNAPATVHPIEPFWLNSPISGSLQTTAVAPGTRVETGQLLAQISPNNITEDLSTLVLNSKRYQDDYEKLASPLSDHDTSSAEWIFHQARMDALKEKQHALQESQSKGAIHADQPGIVYTISRTLQMPVSEDEPLIAMANEFEIEATFDSAIQEAITNAKAVDYFITAQDTNITLTLLDATDSDLKHSSDKHSSDSRSQPTAQRFSVESEHFPAIASQTDWSLEIHVHQSTDSTIVRVPHNALHIATDNAKEWFVWIIDPETKQLLPRTVKIGDVFAHTTTVLEGLTGDEQLVLQIPPWARAGMAIGLTTEANHL